MVTQSIHGVLITADDELRRVLEEPDIRRKLDLVLDFPISLSEFSTGHLEDLRDRTPDLVFLDVEPDPELGCRLAEMISESGAARRIVAVGPPQSPDFLLQAMQSGIADYLTKPIEKPGLLASIERARRGMVAQPKAARKTGRVYTFYSPKGGGGSTTIATNLSIQLHRLTGERTVLVDLNLELGEVAAFLGLEPRYDFVDLAKNLHRMDAGLLASYLTRHEAGIDVLAAPYRPQMADGVTEDQVLQVLRLLRQHYSFVIVDSPKALTQRTIRTLEAADGVFIVAQTNVPTIQNIQRSLGLFEHLTQGGKAVRLIVNRHQNSGDITLSDLERAVEMEVYWTIPNDYAAFSYSMNAGRPLTMNEGSAPAKEIEGLAARVAGLTTEEASRGAGRLGHLLGRLREKLPGNTRGGDVRLAQHPRIEGETA